MKKILVPCDFSQPAINAFRFAMDVVTQSNGSIDLVHVIELPVLHDTVLMPVLNFEQEFLNELREKAESRFSKMVAKYKAEKLKVNFHVLFGAVSRMLIDYTEENKIDLIVMGSHGSSGLREIFVGSNAEKLVRNSSVPVLILKDYYKGPIKNIVFPNTLETEKQEDLIMKVKQLQAFFKAKLHIVWINTPLNFTSDADSMQRLNAFAKRFMLKDYTINIFNDTDEEKGILQYANTVKADLIALGTHGRKGISRLVNGSLAEDVVNHNRGLVWTYTLNHVTALA